LKTALWNHGYKASRATIYEILAGTDDELEGGISFKNLIRLVSKQVGIHGEDKRERRKMFKKYSRRKNYIDEDDINLAAEDLGEHLHEFEAREIVSRLSSN